MQSFMAAVVMSHMQVSITRNSWQCHSEACTNHNTDKDKDMMCASNYIAMLTET